MRRKTLLALAASAAWTLAGMPALAQTAAPAAVPSPAPGGRGVTTLLVGFAAGGTSDAVARLLAQKLPEHLGRPVVVENKPGAIGALAIKEVIGAPADRSVFVVLPFSSVIFPALTQPSLRYDPQRDVQSVASLTSFPLGVVVSASTGVRTPRELSAWLKANPGKAQFGTAGAGGHNHFLGLQLGKAVGVESTVVPYKGNAPLINDLIPGHVPAAVMVAGESVAHAKDGRLNLVGVLSPRRSPLMPQVPTFAEEGIAIESGEAWYGMWASNSLPRAEVARMEDAVRKVLALPEVRETLAGKYAMQADFQPADQTARRLKADVDHWGPIIKASGFKGE